MKGHLYDRLLHLSMCFKKRALCNNVNYKVLFTHFGVWTNLKHKYLIIILTVDKKKY